MINSLAVYCGARDGNDQKYLTAAQQLGEWMAAHQIDLVYGCLLYTSDAADDANWV